MKSFEDLSQQSWYLVSTTLKLKHKFQPAYQCELSLFRFTCSTTPPAHLEMQQYYFYYIPQYYICSVCFVLWKMQGKKIKRAHKHIGIIGPLKKCPYSSTSKSKFCWLEHLLRASVQSRVQWLPVTVQHAKKSFSVVLSLMCFYHSSLNFQVSS